MPNLITLQQFKDAKNISINLYDTQISTLIPLISDYIEKYCRRTFGPASYTEKKRGMMDEMGRYLFQMSNLPIVSVESVTIRFFGTTQDLSVDVSRLDIFESEGYALYSWVLQPSVSVIRAEYQNEYYYTIEYTTNAPVPGGVQLATINALADALDYYFGEPTISGGGSVGTTVKTLKIGDYSEANEGGSNSTFGALHDAEHGIILSQTVKDLLAPYVAYGQSW